MNIRTLTGIGLVALLAAWLVHPAGAEAPQRIDPQPGSRVVLMGNGLGSRMVHYDHFETGLHLRYPDHKLVIRNLCDEGNTPSFRPHSGRGNQLGFPGAEKFFAPYADGNTANGSGHFETDEQWLARLKADVIIAFFGFNESFLGRTGIDNFHAELDAFVKHTLSQKYNGQSTPRLVLVSPIAFEDRSAEMDVPDGKKENGNLAAYTSVIEAVAKANGVLFVDALSPSLKWYAESAEPLTTDGALLNDAGYRKLGDLLVERIFGKSDGAAEKHRDAVHAVVTEKNWLWIADFKIPNGVHVFGQRHNPFGPANYPFEIEKIGQMTDVRDQAIWAAAHGQTIDIAALDAKTRDLPAVQSNYRPGGKNGTIDFLTGDAALASITPAPGFKVQQFATEQEFPDLANPVQLSFDNKGRLWVATMPSYPHWRPGDPRPNDKLLILEDTNHDGKADKQTIWADGLHLPMGFEIAHDGVYVSQGINLVKLSDTDGDGKADTREIVFSGFDDHDTHHAISAFAADESGAIILCEGVFLRSNVETAYGPVRGTNGGFFRFNPARRQIERHAQLSIPNPWGVAYDDWGQHFFLHTSGPTTEWMLPGSIKPRYGEATPGSRDLIEPAHRVRPTSGMEFVSSRHFPDDQQGDMLLCNAIGFLGIKQHKMLENGTGYDTKWRQDLIRSSDGNFRPVDLEFAPDGSLYVVDWHNPLIGHMQHSARDPHRDHTHGRIYRITYPDRPLVEPAKIDGASIPQLLENLKLPEYRTRYRTRRELRGRDADEVAAAVGKWVASLDKNDPRYEHHLTEALWVTWGMNQVDASLLRRLLASPDYRARAAAARVLRYSGHQVSDHVDLLKQAARDAHGRVKLEAIVAASWLGKSDGLAVLDAAVEKAKPEPGDEGKLVKVGPGGGTIEITVPEAARGKVAAFTMTVPGSDRVINLAEMELYADRTNITKRAKLSQSSEYQGGQFPIGNLVDGDKGNFSHTAFSDNPSIRVEFDAPIALDLIKIWNRPAFEGRFDGAKVAFLGGGGELASVSVRVEGGDAGGGPFGGDAWLNTPYRTALARLNNQPVEEKIEVVAVPEHLKGAERDMFVKGAEIYRREGFCITCHQPDGNGLEPAGFPPLTGTEWVNQDSDRLIKLTLDGLLGPIDVKGKAYPGLVPMLPFRSMLNDAEVASVLTYVRNSFGNKASPITADQVERVRNETKDRAGQFWNPADLLKLHPHK